MAVWLGSVDLIRDRSKAVLHRWDNGVVNQCLIDVQMLPGLTHEMNGTFFV